MPVIPHDQDLINNELLAGLVCQIHLLNRNPVTVTARLCQLDRRHARLGADNLGNIDRARSALTNLLLLGIQPVGIVLGHHLSQLRHNLALRHGRHAHILLALGGSGSRKSSLCSLDGIWVTTGLVDIKRLHRGRQTGRWLRLSCVIRSTG